MDTKTLEDKILAGYNHIVFFEEGNFHYHIAGKFGREKVWWIDSFRAFGERKFGRINRSANRLSIVSTKLVWRITDDSPNSPNFPTIWYFSKSIAIYENFTRKMYWLNKVVLEQFAKTFLSKRSIIWYQWASFITCLHLLFYLYIFNLLP